MNRGQFIVAAAFDVALAFEVHDHRALLRLEGVMSTRADEALDDVVKRVVVVVEQRQAPLVVKQHIGEDVFLGFDSGGPTGGQGVQTGHRL